MITLISNLISSLTNATTPLAGTEAVAIEQSGQNKKTSVSNLTTGRDVSVKTLTAQANAVAATAGNPAAGVPLVAGAVEVLRFLAGWYFSGVADAATTVYLTPGEGL